MTPEQEALLREADNVNPPDRTIDKDRWAAQLIFDLARELRQSTAENERLRSFSKAYSEDVFIPFTEEETKQWSVIITRASAAMGRHCAKFMSEAADALAALAQVPREPVGVIDPPSGNIPYKHFVRLREPRDDEVGMYLYAMPHDAATAEGRKDQADAALQTTDARQK